MIACPKCGSGKSSVISTKPDGKGKWRRRTCSDCGFKFSTVERIKTSRIHPTEATK
ncbi:NrdR family transcriptional regulator [Candidatus Vondammii sp. HM_W22]|uniref:NrdR family transcriptional regulator n=1 Tax=Candidatus Vondammii sp. HM_W22 TaxID=2687299 RepID=UPI00403E0179